MSKNLPQIPYGPWSPSKAGLAGSCPLAFKYRYIDRIPGQGRSTAAKVGVTVHRAQELHLEGVKVGTAITQSITESEEELTEKEKEDVRTFAVAIEDFAKKMVEFQKRYPAREINVERQWAITPSFEPCDFDSKDGIIRGIVDLSLFLENGYVIIIDHKSGRVRPITYYRTQLDFYAIMALSYYPELKGVQCAVNYLAADAISWGKPLSKRHIRDVLRPWLFKYLKTKADTASTSQPKLGRHCNWCDYREMCPARGSKDATD